MAIIHLSNAMAAVQKAMLRQCPQCQEKQSVALSRSRESVKCRKCGGQVPPQRRVDDK